MVKITGLDIPPGMEDNFFAIAQFGDGSTQTKLNLKRNKATNYRKAQWNYNSFFVRYQFIYMILSQMVHDEWTAYWITLPFGNHDGAGGYPGSGYSAFIYFNAPRIRAGLPLQLEPPVTNLITNGSFNGNANGWYLYNMFYDNHKVTVTSYGNETMCRQTGWGTAVFSLTPLAQYRLTLVLNLNSFNLRALIYSPSYGDFLSEDWNFSGSGTFHVDFTCPLFCHDGALGLFGESLINGSIISVSLVPL